ITGLLEASRQASMVVLGQQSDHQHGIGLGVAVRPLAEGAHSDVAVICGRSDALRREHHRVCVLLGSGADERALRAGARFATLREVPLLILQPAGPAGPRSPLAPTQVRIDALANAERLVRRQHPTVTVTAELI